MALVLLAGCNAVFGLDEVKVVDSGIDAYVPDGAVAYLPLDRASNAGSPDNVGADATCTECPAFTAGKVDRAASFTETNQLLRLERRVSLETATAYTVALWLKLDQLPLAASYTCVIQKLYGTSKDNSWQLCFDAVGHTHYIVQTATGPQNFQGPIVMTGQWHHYALVWNGDVVSLFIDGAVTPVQMAGISVLFDGGVVTVGADLDEGAPVYAPTGLVDDVRIYDVALSSDQIQALPGF